MKSEVLFLTLYSLRFTIYGLEGRVRLAGFFQDLIKLKVLVLFCHTPLEVKFMKRRCRAITISLPPEVAEELTL